MKTTTTSRQLLNGIQQILIDHSNRNGINLADEFASVEDFKKFVIAFAFKSMTDAGFEVPEAFDATLGEGQYEALFSRMTA